MTRGVDDRIDEGVLRRFGHVEIMENDRIAKKVYVWECTGIRSLGRPRKRRISTSNDCLKKIDLDIRQEGRMVHDRGVWWGFVRENMWGVARGANP